MKDLLRGRLGTAHHRGRLVLRSAFTPAVRRRRMARILGIGLALSITSAAAAYWTSTGAGTAAATTATPLPLTVSAGTPLQRLHPGGQADLALTIANPNGYTARVGALSLDVTQGTGGYAVDSGHLACGVSSLSFLAQGNNGAGWSVPPNASLGVNLPGAVSMSLDATQSCQGATFTVYLIASADYLTSTLTTAGLVSYWRLGDDPAVADNLTGTVGTTLQAHTGEMGATWTALAGSGSANEVITDANRVRRNGSYTVYYASGAASGADYAVQADVHVRSTVATDKVGVIGRVDTTNANGTFYYARYDQGDTAWHLLKYANGVITNLATSSSAALSVGQTYRLRLDMIGTALKLYVNEVLTTSATDGTITSAGRGGLLDGDWKPASTTTANTNSTGLQLDNVRVVANTGTTVTDRLGGNPGTFGGTPLLNVTGALSYDLNPAVRFNGSSSYASVTGPVADNFSIEFWFASTQGIGTSSAWTNGAGMVDANGSADDFGISLRSDGRVAAGVGAAGGDTSVLSASAGYNTGAWHHVVMTRTRSSGVFVLYVDGSLAGSATGSTASLTTPTTINFGRLATATNYFAGSLDEVAIYNAALSAATVSEHYHVGHGS